MLDLFVVGGACAFGGLLAGYKLGYERGFEYVIKKWRGEDK